MAFSRGKYGIEYNVPAPIVNRRRGVPPLAVALVAIVALLAAGSFALTLARRYRSRRAEDAQAREATLATGASVATEESELAPRPSAPPLTDEPPLRTGGTVARRPQRVENLLMRLEEAERKRDLVMAVNSIEQLRAMPGAPAADLDDALVRRLGVLNARWLFELRNAQWVSEVTVKGGDSLARIAREHGSTVASAVRLNPGVDPDRITVGQKLKVMNHPRFNLVVHRRSQTADLQLNGKLFRRYDLVAPVRSEPGAYELTANARRFWAERSLEFSAADRRELETLLPGGTSVLVSEL